MLEKLCPCSKMLHSFYIWEQSSKMLQGFDWFFEYFGYPTVCHACVLNKKINVEPKPEKGNE